ncbi:hypothetical protein [Zavarzinella formosa]|uniref:hypothetical protein n=1 Tax=Zavarzinella formosa TaxID=360055 RepID=UPI0004982527|nr:hypothetical protein [Zavarzinella formosa]
MKDWSEFQHYKDRSPPWIRLHKRLLDNFRFHSLPDASRALAPMLWLLASENKDPSSGLIDLTDEEIAFRIRRTLEELQTALKPLLEKDFLELSHGDSASLASCKQLAVPETETEAGREAEAENEDDDMRASAKTPFERVYDYGCNLFPQLVTQATSVIHQWLDGGADIDLDIIPEIKRLHDKKIQPRGWGLFTQDIANSKLRRNTPLPKGELKNDRPATKHGNFAAQDYRAGTEGFIVA